LGSKEGSPYRSWAVHGVDGRAGELDGDSVACRLRVAVDGPKRGGALVGTSRRGGWDGGGLEAAVRMEVLTAARAEGVVGDRTEERSVVLFDGSVGSAVVGLG
jgi:hypothetical protein